MIRQPLPISASIITLNEERNIRDCLMSVDFCQEKKVIFIVYPSCLVLLCYLENKTAVISYLRLNSK